MKIEFFLETCMWLWCFGSYSSWINMLCIHFFHHFVASWQQQSFPIQYHPIEKEVKRLFSLRIGPLADFGAERARQPRSQKCRWDGWVFGSGIVGRFFGVVNVWTVCELHVSSCFFPYLHVLFRCFLYFQMLGRDFVALNQGVLRLSGPKTKKMIKRRHEQQPDSLLQVLSWGLYSYPWPWAILAIFSKISQTQQADPLQKFKRCEACEAVQQCLAFDMWTVQILQGTRFRKATSRTEGKRRTRRTRDVGGLDFWWKWPRC